MGSIFVYHNFKQRVVMEKILSRGVVFFTPNKRYIGKMDLQNEGMRTLDLLNSSNLYWKDPKDKSFNDSILLHDGLIEVAGGKKLTKFNNLQIRLSDIIFFTDNLSSSGSDTEKKRAETLSNKSSEKKSHVKIITRMCGDSFYIIRGSFFGLFKNKSQQRFLPLTKPSVKEILRTGADWSGKEIDVGQSFIGLSINHIESCTLEE